MRTTPAAISFLLTVLTILLIPPALASSSCPCSRISHAPGLLVAYTCTNGTTDNVTFYLDEGPAYGGELSGWALKQIGMDQVPTRELVLTLFLDSSLVANATTDLNGFFSFDISKAGEYLLCGGDAKLGFNITEPAGTVSMKDGADSNVSGDINGFKTINETAESNTGQPNEENAIDTGNNYFDANGPDADFSDTDGQASGADITEEPAKQADAPPGKRAGKQEDYSYLFYLLPLVIILAVVFYLRKRK